MSTEQEQGPTPEEARSGALLEISNAMVRLYKDQFGRGPTKARTYWCGTDMVTTVLEDTLTPAERNLVKMHEHQRLRDTRIFFQYATVRCSYVKQGTGMVALTLMRGLRVEAWSGLVRGRVASG